MRQKVKRGEYPAFAPIGYLNDPRIKGVVVGKKKSVIIKKALELYAENNSRLKEISAKLQRLLDGYLEQDIEREICRLEKAKLLS